jgi:hypothetical protein
MIIPEEDEAFQVILVVLRVSPAIEEVLDLEGVREGIEKLEDVDLRYLAVLEVKGEDCRLFLYVDRHVILSFLGNFTLFVMILFFKNQNAFSVYSLHDLWELTFEFWELFWDHIRTLFIWGNHQSFVSEVKALIGNKSELILILKIVQGKIALTFYFHIEVHSKEVVKEAGLIWIGDQTLLNLIQNLLKAFRCVCHVSEGKTVLIEDGKLFSYRVEIKDFYLKAFKELIFVSLNSSGEFLQGSNKFMVIVSVLVSKHAKEDQEVSQAIDVPESLEDWV